MRRLARAVAVVAPSLALLATPLVVPPTSAAPAPADRAVLEQRFQTLEAAVRVGNRHGLCNDMKLRGDAISFVLMMTVPGLGFVRHEFAGRVRADRMEGLVRITMPPKTEEEYEDLEVVSLPWQAERVASSAFFAPVGVDIR